MITSTQKAVADPAIVRTEQGLVFVGTRVTLYDVMDFLAAGWPPHLLPLRLPLNEAQVQAAMDYIASHRDEVEAEYQAAIRETEQNRAYWEVRNRERFAEIASAPTPPEQEALRSKLAAWKARIAESE
jgi:uncharacterized protein (DUF433 family)